VRCNALGAEVRTAQTKCVQRVREEYAARFPELERLVPEPGEYVALVRRSYNVEDISTVPLRELLPPATVIVVVTTAAQRTLPSLPAEVGVRVRYHCDCYLWLEETRQRMLRFVEGRMGLMAPNVSALCGNEVAARLVATAGGLRALSRMPSSSLQRLGAARRTLGGLSSTQVARESYLTAAALVTSAPPSLRQRAARLLAGKCSLAARVDAYRESADGAVGERYHAEIEERLRKLYAPPPARQVKALPVPDEQRRRRRGGRRYRKQRERSAITELARQQSRVAFGVSAGDDRDTSVGLSAHGGGAAAAATGVGRVRLTVRTTASAQLSQKRKRQLAAQVGRSGTTTGLASSLAFTPVQGLELEDPSAAAARQRKVEEANSSYFSDAAGFNTSGGGGTVSAAATTTGATATAAVGGDQKKRNRRSGGPASALSFKTPASMRTSS
jgi:U4/U6 small nuclear ribonucleoprotein PRP31